MKRLLAGLVLVAAGDGCTLDSPRIATPDIRPATIAVPEMSPPMIAVPTLGVPVAFAAGPQQRAGLLHSAPLAAPLPALLGIGRGVAPYALIAGAHAPVLTVGSRIAGSIVVAIEEQSVALADGRRLRFPARSPEPASRTAVYEVPDIAEPPAMSR